MIPTIAHRASFESELQAIERIKGYSVDSNAKFLMADDEIKGTVSRKSFMTRRARHNIYRIFFFILNPFFRSLL
jgi:hypothetical protein